MKIYDKNNFFEIPQVIKYLSSEKIEEIKIVASILPFKTNSYVIENLIDWNNIENDSMYHLTFMNKKMLDDEDYEEVKHAFEKKYSIDEINRIIKKIRTKLNPNPSGQLTHNVPEFDGKKIHGIQHKYKNTVLVFPSAGQTCFSYCTFCFRWPQFIKEKELQFSTDKDNIHLKYIKNNKEISDVLITGGDPLIMRARHLRDYIEPLLTEEFEHIKSIRIGTKALSYWPNRFLTDFDSEDLLNLFKKIINSGKHLTIMAHINHYKEIESEVAINAIKILRSIGIEIRTQSPILKHVNNDAEVWVKMWNQQVNLGCVPYYMFIERDTGSKRFFEVPLVEALEIYNMASKNVSGLAKTARGPVMSSLPGKILIDGILEINNEKHFTLKFIQARNPEFCNKIFLAKYDEKATWLNNLKPSFDEKEFFFEKLEP